MKQKVLKLKELLNLDNTIRVAIYDKSYSTLDGEIIDANKKEIVLENTKIFELSTFDLRINTETKEVIITSASFGFNLKDNEILKWISKINYISKNIDKVIDIIS